jgi:hypothetical protein
VVYILLKIPPYPPPRQGEKHAKSMNTTLIIGARRFERNRGKKRRTTKEKKVNYIGKKKAVYIG